MPSKQDNVETRRITAEEAEECASEQIQFINSIQPHGFIFIVDPSTNQIVQHSDNALSHINLQLDKPLPATDSLLDSDVRTWLKFKDQNPFDELSKKRAFEIEITHKGRISNKFWECTGHLTEQWICLEFLPKSPDKYKSQNLILKLDRIVENIRESSSPQALYDTITQQFQLFTHYDRVMMYRFLPDWSGEIVSEAVSKGNDIRFLNMRFPAEDIPKQARELFSNSSLRVLADVDAESSKLIPECLPNGKPVNLGLSILRSMSLMHIVYLKNMKVKATMSIALMSHGKLWGLMAFHHNTPKTPPNHVVSQLKSSCELFTEVISSYLHPAIDLSKLKKLMNSKNIIEKVFHSVEKLDLGDELFRIVLSKVQQCVEFDYVGIGYSKHCYVVDNQQFRVLNSQANKQILSLFKTKDEVLFESHQLLDPENPNKIELLPEMAGVIVKRSTLANKPFVFFGRKELITTVNWAGQPQSVNIVIKNGERTLEPRSSFSLWRQRVNGHSEIWEKQDTEILSAFFESTKDAINLKHNEKLMQQLEQSAHFDALTGLANRQYLKEFINTFCVSENKNQLLTIFFIDLDNFKEINDYMGHDTGDRLLIEVANRLKNCVRPDDLVVRLGGDEFLIVINDKDLSQEEISKAANLIGNKIIACVGQPFFDNEHTVVVTTSIGVNVCKVKEIEFEEILKQADIALYHAKSEGKNCIHFFSENDQANFNKNAQITLDLRKAIEKNLLDIQFQPQINSENQVTGAEVLCRWNNPNYGNIPPEVFIFLAEKSNLIYDLGLKVFEKSCQQLYHWKQDHLESEYFETLSINVSPAQVLTDGLHNDLKRIIEKYEIDTKQIRLEITETVFMKRFDEAVAALQRLRDNGFSISLDDFGTGYSSLSYLLNLPIDEVKIDKSFISNINLDDSSFTMVEGIISLCKKMNLEVVAEGVESNIQYNILKGLGCDTYQGYYFSKPLTANNFLFQLN